MYSYVRTLWDLSGAGVELGRGCQASRVCCIFLGVIKTSLRWVLLLVFLAGFGDVAQAQSYKYFRVGNKEDIQTKPVAGIAMMGGEAYDEAFRWLCEKGNGGDFLILRGAGRRQIQLLCERTLPGGTPVATWVPS